MAINRLINKEYMLIHPLKMMITAIGALIVNIVMMRTLHSGHGHHGHHHGHDHEHAHEHDQKN